MFDLGHHNSYPTSKCLEPISKFKELAHDMTRHTRIKSVAAKFEHGRKWRSFDISRWWDVHRQKRRHVYAKIWRDVHAEVRRNVYTKVGGTVHVEVRWLVNSAIWRTVDIEIRRAIHIAVRWTFCARRRWYVYLFDQCVPKQYTTMASVCEGT